MQNAQKKCAIKRKHEFKNYKKLFKKNSTRE